jgi:hypothetical protein
MKYLVLPAAMLMSIPTHAADMKLKSRKLDGEL